MGCRARLHTRSSLASRHPQRTRAHSDRRTDNDHRCPVRCARESYDGDVPSSRASSPAASRRAVLPGGVVATRRAIRRRGGLMGVAVAAGLWILGLLFGALLSDPIGGAASFLFLVMALPVMPLLGMPATGGTARLYLAIVSSAVLWWLLGQVVASRVARRPVVGWREWMREFAVMGLGLWLGAAGGLILGALALGAL